MNRRIRMIAVLMAVLAGIFSGFLIRQLMETGKGEDQEAAAIRQAKEVLTQEEERLALLQSQNTELEQRKKELLRRLEEYEDVSGILTEMRENAFLSAMTDVEGSGIVLTLDDKLDYDPLTDPIEAVIHDSTVNYILNILWTAGARAIAFNGVRLTAVSEISCVGPTILCYGIRQMPPYVFEAIGPEESMKTALETDSYLVHLIQAKIGIRRTITTADHLLLPSFSKTHDFLPYIGLLRTP
ncbi:MAG: DUF881 domain-containing protein [Clostridiaceae bacterium]|nr:DUF881 domain-containing protein [Clostridiaceae bacterium]